MTSINPEIWSLLEQSLPIGENLTARLGMPDTSKRLLCGIDAECNRHLLVKLNADEGALNDTNSRGIRILTRELTIKGTPPATYLDIHCIDSAGHEVFNLIGADIAVHLAKAQRTPADIARIIISKWRRFWGKIPQVLLSREQIIGLFAEIWFLNIWLLPHISSDLALSRWRGPFGARHDFEWSVKSVEVKASTSQRGLIHRINGIEQLSPPEGGELYFFSLHLREEAGATNSLPLIVMHTREKIADNDEALTIYENALIQAGYSQSHDDEYSRLHLRIIGESLFSVRDDFPRITSEEVELSSGVEQVIYEINLNAFDHLIVSDAPNNVGDLLL